MFDKIIASGGALLLIVVIVILLCIAPMILLWCLNTLSEQGDLGYYIPHNFWTYLASIGILVYIRGGKS